MKYLTLESGSEWRRGWPVLLSGMAGIALLTIHIYATGLFFQPLEKEFGWPRSEVASALLLPSILAFLLTPFFARLIDRHGARKVAIPGTIIYCLAVMSLAFTTKWIGSWWLLWGFIGFALSVASQAVWSTGIASWFSKNRAVALAIAYCGTGIGATCVPLLTNLLINHFGWRGALIGLGVIGMVAILPIIVLFFYDARYGTRDRSNAAVITPVKELAGFSVAEGLRSRYFYQLAFAAFAGTAAIVGILVHLVPLLTTYGISRNEAAQLAGMVGVPSIIGRLSIGFLLDRFSGPLVGSISISLPILSVILLVTFPGSLPAAVVAILILGLSIGGEYDAVIYLSTRFFGLRNYGTLFGFVAALITLGLGLGPAIGGLVYDKMGSYQPYLAMLIPVWILSGLAILTLGRYPHEDLEHPKVIEAD